MPLSQTKEDAMRFLLPAIGIAILIVIGTALQIHFSPKHVAAADVSLGIPLRELHTNRDVKTLPEQEAVKSTRHSELGQEETPMITRTSSVTGAVAGRSDSLPPRYIEPPGAEASKNVSCFADSGAHTSRIPAIGRLRMAPLAYISMP
jgi:hypothetical protein